MAVNYKPEFKDVSSALTFLTSDGKTGASILKQQTILDIIYLRLISMIIDSLKLNKYQRNYLTTVI